jgi:hypothetical protein
MLWDCTAAAAKVQQQQQHTVISQHLDSTQVAGTAFDIVFMSGRAAQLAGCHNLFAHNLSS